MKKHNIKVNGATVSIIGDVANEDAYISLTDIAKYKNPDFNRMEFQTVKSEPGRLIMTPSQWIERMNAIGITSKAGRYGRIYAHSDIAFEFASWVSLEF